MEIYERIKQRRKEIGLSAEYVAEQLGVSPATIYRYENNYIKKFPTDILEPLAKILRTTPTYLMGYDAPMKREKNISEKDDTLSEGEEYLLELFRKIPDDKKQLAIEMLKAALQAK